MEEQRSLVQKYKARKKLKIMKILFLVGSGNND